MSTKAKTILTFTIIGIILAAFIVISFLTRRIPLNDVSMTGNTPGNLNNGGYFCETEEKIYFGNAYDGYKLYSMNRDGTELKKLGENPVYCLNAGGKYLYYTMQTNSDGSGLGFMYKTSGIYRSKLNGKSTVCLDRCYILAMQLCGSYIYYEKYDNKAGTSLEKIRIDKKDKQTIANYIVNPVCYVNGKIYYNGTQKDHYLYALDTSNDTSSTVWTGNIWNPIYHNGYVYYMDVENNYLLCRYSMSDDVVEVLTNDRVDLFNVYDNMIYFQTNSETAPALKRMYVDGSSLETVSDGVYENINITSQYVYFNTFGEPTPVYQTSTYGPVNVTTFDAAKQAALEQTK